MKSAVAGVLLVVLFNFLQSTQIVTLGNMLQSVDPVVVMLLTFSLATFVFLALQVRRLPTLWERIKKSPWDVLGLNIATLMSWLPLLFALKYMEPAAADAIAFSIGPLITVLFWKKLRPKKPVVLGESIAAVGILFGVLVLSLISWQGFSAMGQLPLRNTILGLINAVLCGFGVVGCVVFSKRLGEKGVTAGQMLGLRFFVLMAVGIFFWPAGVALSQFSSTFYSEILMIAVVGVIVPLYVLQLGIQRCEPITVSLILSLLPAFSYGMQFFDDRLQNSPLSLIGISICIFFTAVGVRARFSADKKKKKFIAIVDAYSAGSQYAPLFKERGFECLHIQSAPELLAAFKKSYRPDDFSIHVIHNGDLKETLKTLRQYPIHSLLTGTETGVELADQLSEALGLITNGTQLSSGRRDKYRMQETIATKGLRSIRQFKSDSLEAILKWSRENSFTNVVLKPIASAGTDSVFICHDEPQIKDAFEAIIGKTSAMGTVNAEVLAQEFIVGTEYVVNTVSYNGTRRVTDIIRYTKKEIEKGSRVYEQDTFLDESGEIEKSLIAYNHKVLDALEINNGPSHAEIYYTVRGPVLVEVASRSDGLADFYLSSKFSNGNQILSVVDFYTDPNIFLKDANTTLALHKQAAVVYHIVPEGGVIESMPKIDEIKKLRSFIEMKLKVKAGDVVPRTTDIFTCPMYVFLAHEDFKVLQSDIDAIREMEKGGLFQLVSSREATA